MLGGAGVGCGGGGVVVYVDGGGHDDDVQDAARYI